MDSRIERVCETFKNRFGHEPTHVIRAPGRVNLIGEHTDYNQGFVLPMAIDRDILVAASPREDKAVSLYAMQYGTSSLFSLDLVRHSRSNWSNYVRGTVAVFQGSGHSLKGFNAVFEGNIPQGGGLSSSAALEVAFSLLLSELNKLSIDRLALAQLARRAENEFVGVQCGIMDQFVSLFGKKDSAIFLDCRDLSHKNIPLVLDRYGLKLVLVDSGVKRGLIESAYNARRLECEQGVAILRTKLGRKEINSLRDVSSAEFTSLAESLPETICKRSWHVISENERVKEAVDALEKGD
ncbi:MAG TPA: galactokinase, partial [Chroococcales cyanobacterium]